jgi:hypothetical protein
MGERSVSVALPRKLRTIVFAVTNWVFLALTQIETAQSER